MNDWLDAEARVERAHDLYDKGRWAEAAAELQAAIAINPYNASWHFNLGLTFEAMEEYGQACKAYRASLALTPNDIETLNCLGVNLTRLGQYAQALGTFEEISRLDADYEELRKRFKPSARNKIRKALKAGVGVRRAESEADFLLYYTVLEECSRDWEIRPRPGPAFFSALSKLDQDVVQMWLAVRDGHVLGGDLNFAMHGTVMNWGNVSTDAAKSRACRV